MDDWVKKTTERIKKECNGPSDFLKQSIASGIPVTYPEVFLDVYYYGKHINSTRKEVLLEES